MKPHITPNHGLVSLVASFLLMLVGLAGTANPQNTATSAISFV